MNALDPLQRTTVVPRASLDFSLRAGSAAVDRGVVIPQRDGRLHRFLARPGRTRTRCRAAAVRTALYAALAVTGHPSAASHETKNQIDGFVSAAAATSRSPTRVRSAHADRTPFECEEPSMHTRAVFRWFCLVIAVAWSSAALAAAAPKGAPKGAALAIGLASELRSIDPHRAATPGDDAVAAHVFESLVPLRSRPDARARIGVDAAGRHDVAVHAAARCRLQRRHGADGRRRGRIGAPRAAVGQRALRRRSGCVDGRGRRPAPTCGCTRRRTTSS